jgi:hypothetical protein
VDATRIPGQESPIATLRQFVRKRSPTEKCELCSAEIGGEHAHLIDPESRKLLCACEACSILFSHRSGAKYKRVPRMVRFLPNFRMTDVQWGSLLIPIEMAFFFYSTPLGRTVVFYPSPAGATESILPLDSWNDIVKNNPELAKMEPDVEALLVNRVGHVRGLGAGEYFVVPIDECYRLVGLIRTHWRGFSGGTEVWKEIGACFSQLKKKAGVETEETSA